MPENVSFRKAVYNKSAHKSNFSKRMGKTIENLSPLGTGHTTINKIFQLLYMLNDYKSFFFSVKGRSTPKLKTLVNKRFFFFNFYLGRNTYNS